MDAPSADRKVRVRDDSSEAVMAAIVEALSGMRFGQVTVVVQDGRVVQIDRMERRRLKS